MFRRWEFWIALVVTGVNAAIATKLIPQTPAWGLALAMTISTVLLWMISTRGEPLYRPGAPPEPALVRLHPETLRQLAELLRPPLTRDDPPRALQVVDPELPPDAA